MDPVPFFDLKRQYTQLKPRIIPAIEEVLEKTAYSGGEFVKNFEKNFAEYINVQYARGVNSGTSSLHLALLALGVKPGDEIIVPAHTFIASAWCISYIGAKPVFVDCLSTTWEIDPQAVEKAVTDKTRAIIAVHLYGVPADITSLAAIAKKNNLFLIEDCAQAHGSLYEGKRVGGIGDIGCFSFYPSKNLGAYGDGGAITTNNETWALRVEALRNHGIQEKYIHKTVGYNMRMAGIQAAVLNLKLQYLDQWNERKATIVKRYREEIQNPRITMQEISPVDTVAYHLFVVTVPNRKKFMEHLALRGIQTAMHYPVPCHLQEAYSGLGYKKGSLPHSEYIAEHCVSLPLFPELTPQEVTRVIEAVNSYA